MEIVDPATGEVHTTAPRSGPQDGGLETTLTRWADECHAQGGTVVLAHFPVPNGEAAALIATGRLDGVEEHIRTRAGTAWPGPADHRHGGADHVGFLLDPLVEARRTLLQRLPRRP